MHVASAVALTTLTFALLCPACAPDDEDAEFRITSGSGSGSGSGPGTVFNTNMVDDAWVSELYQPMGDPHLGIVLDDVEVPGGEAVTHFEVDDGELVVFGKKGGVYTEETAVDSVWQLYIPTYSTTKPTWMRLAERIELGGWPHYRFTTPYGQGTCVGGPGPIYTRLLPGFTLDEATGGIKPLAGNTYVACTNGATGKAAALGYYDLSVGLGDFTPLEVAIRAIRADYCYDGVSHTTPGIEVHIEDRWGVLGEPSDAPIEAVWGAHGLVCSNTGREGPIASCGALFQAACAEGTTLPDYPDGLFITRLP
ncbi:ADYC domain-containing protein [Nannocystis sp. SCPEA4]|uniref:ADYC domain-containing protein n=1 Tax=Nannocystis sp. SCPEA4 TaxID=2996787 RepID=UPI00226F3166|nr:ADYC domain-containing protein [Nannocystis sp. SCPEA4]MCY1056676.1 ADYC domain-containing protein [Nannocystis sp. SCPEA4]